MKNTDASSAWWWFVRSLLTSGQWLIRRIFVDINRNVTSQMKVINYKNMSRRYNSSSDVTEYGYQLYKICPEDIILQMTSQSMVINDKNMSRKYIVLWFSLTMSQDYKPIENHHNYFWKINFWQFQKPCTSPIEMSEPDSDVLHNQNMISKGFKVGY